MPLGAVHCNPEAEENPIQLQIWPLKTMAGVIVSLHFRFADGEERAQERGSVDLYFYSILIELLAVCSPCCLSNGRVTGEFPWVTEK